jgi:hypothetical protein
MKSLSLNRQTLAAVPTWLSFIFITVALTVAPSPGKAQLLMNLAPQALPNNTVGPTYTGTLNAVKQRLNTPTPGQIESKPQQALTLDAARRQTPNPSATMPAAEVCGLKVSQMNDIQKHKVVKINVGPCLMVFNAND